MHQRDIPDIVLARHKDFQGRLTCLELCCCIQSLRHVLLCAVSGIGHHQLLQKNKAKRHIRQVGAGPSVDIETLLHGHFGIPSWQLMLVGNFARCCTQQLTHKAKNRLA